MSDLDALRDKLRAIDDTSDGCSWSQERIQVLREAGCFGNVIAREFSGNATPPLAQLQTYHAVGAGSTSAALILTQHDSACELLGHCGNDGLKQRLLPQCAAGDKLATVGISQLTTSRRHSGAAAMRATLDGDAFILDGVMPWVTSVRHADVIVTGAVLDDNRQILACVPMDAPGLAPGEPMDLMALRSSWTSEVHCDGVRVTPDDLLSGPAEKVLAIRAPVKPLKVSGVGLGLATTLYDESKSLASNLGDAEQLMTEAVTPTYEAVRERLFAAADQLNDPAAEIPSGEIRSDVNALLVRLAATVMTLAKGSGFLSSHPVQRLVREAMFFMVWSAPDPVRLGTLRRVWSST